MAELSAFSSKPHTVNRDILSGWKEIANYLGKGVRTVQRYERELQLPVRRPAGKDRGSVIALCLDLDAWVSQTPMRLPDLVSLASQHREDLKSALSTLRSLCGEARALRSAITVERTTLKTGIHRIAESLSQSDLRAAEKHGTVAAEQKERARETIENARIPFGHAMKMGKPPDRRSVAPRC